MNLKIYLQIMTIVICIAVILTPGVNSADRQFDLLLVEYKYLDIMESYRIDLYDYLNDFIIIGVSEKDYQVLENNGIHYYLADSEALNKDYYIVNLFKSGKTVTDKALKNYDILFQDNDDLLIRASSSEAERLTSYRMKIRKLFLDPKPYRPHLQEYDQKSLSYDPVIHNMINAVTTDNVHYYCGSLSGEWPVNIGGSDYTITSRHSNYSTGIEKATQYAYEFFANLGLDAEYHYFPGPGQRNVIAKQTGTVYPDAYYMICGHIDSMPSGSVSPGADDNASGSVAVLLAAELFADYLFDYSLIFALWTGEEQGLYGSYYYAQDAYNSGMDIRGVINLDMIAWESNGNPVITIHAKQNQIPYSMVLANTMTDVIDAYDINLDPIVLANGYGFSDHESFWNKGYAAILGIEDFYDDFNPYYHTVNDKLIHLNLTYFRDFTRASLATIAHLAGISQESGIVYRFFNTVRGGHLYTVSEYERDYIMQNLPEWSYEGPKFKVHEEQVAGTSATYRFFNTITGIHLYTISEYERDIVMGLPEWNYEGIKFYVFADYAGGTIPVYRFFNHVRGGHLYTISEDERDVVMTLPEWTYEGIPFYVLPL